MDKEKILQNCGLTQEQVIRGKEIFRIMNSINIELRDENTSDDEMLIIEVEELSLLNELDEIDKQSTQQFHDLNKS